MLLGQEHHADAVIPGPRQHHPLLGHFLTEKEIRNLNQNSCAIAHQGIGPNSAAVIQIFQDQQPLLNNRMAFFAFDMRHETDTTGVVFICGVIQALSLW